MKPYLIWDWNGTLLDDVDAALNAFNRILSARHLPLWTRPFYRTHFRFPVRTAYLLAGVDLAHDNWDALCQDFHRFLLAEKATLAPSACAALTVARDKGYPQALLSALRTDLLSADVARFKLTDFFTHIYGSDNLEGSTKSARGQALLAALGVSPARVILIGDTTHDAEVARDLGARCVLVSCGHQDAARLEQTGLPVVATPRDAVQFILNLTEKENTK